MLADHRDVGIGDLLATGVLDLDEIRHTSSLIIRSHIVLYPLFGIVILG